MYHVRLSSGLPPTLLLALASACSSPGDALEQYDAAPPELQSSVSTLPELEAVLTEQPGFGFRRDGATLVPVSVGSSTPPSVRVRLPLAAHGDVEIHPVDSPSHRLTLLALHASAGAARLDDSGRVHYERAFGSADLIQTLRADGFHQTIVVHDAESPDLFVWRATLNGLERAAATNDMATLLLDDEGVARLLVTAVQIVDAAGNVSTTRARFDDDGYVRVDVDHRFLEYPVLVSFGAQIPPTTLMSLPAQTNGRVMVLLDTSGSMLWRFADNTNLGGDSDATAVFCDNILYSTQPAGVPIYRCNANTACTVANGGRPVWPVASPATNPSRMLASKRALTNVINAHNGVLDFGLMRFIEEVVGTAPTDCANTVNPQYCCRSQIDGATRGRCVLPAQYTNLTNSPTTLNVTYFGGCPTSGGGGRILVEPGPSSGVSILPWINFKENFCSSTAAVSGAPRDPEIRGEGNTPLARAVVTARTNWYAPIYNASKTTPDPSSPLYDPQIDCRSYVLVVMTDGVNNCGLDPSSEVQTLTNVNSVNPVKTYVLGMGATGGLDPTELGQMATAGGTGAPAYASSQAQIEAAFADIVASTVKYEQCNAKDDNCNQLIDEGLGVYQECSANGQCGSGTCSSGRCTCSSTAQCSSGHLCASGFCRPVCSVGVGECRRDGVRKCSTAGAACCVNDGQASCTALTAKPAATEICNGLDDNCNGIIDDVPGGCQGCTPLPEICNGIDDNCNGIIDDNAIDVGKPCGLNIGQCKPGLTVCVAEPPHSFPHATDHLECAGGTPPASEVCNGYDDDCDGVTDGMTKECYTGSAGTKDVGVCMAGVAKCEATPATGEAWGPCLGQITPTAEICDQRDNDCDGEIDEGVGDGFGHVTGEPCCGFGSLCGKGVCEFGQYACAGAQVVCAGGAGPSSEICDDLDNDCNGKMDDVPGVGTACVHPTSSCAGTLQCNVANGSLQCIPLGIGALEICNGLDDDCDGSVDEEPDVSQNDGALGQACQQPVAPNDQPPCKAGVTVCKNGQVACTGAVGPQPEICDGLDNDCDGVIDLPDPCPGDQACVSGVCRSPCRSGEFPCPGGQVCVDSYCVEPDADAGSGGSGGSAGGGGGGGDAGSGAAGSPSDGGTGGSAGASGGSSSDGGTTQPGTGGSGVLDQPGDASPAQDEGGCGCRLARGPEPSHAAWLVTLLLAAIVRRRFGGAQ